MRQENVVWAYNDMDAARRLLPRVKALVEKQVAEGELDLSLADQRQLVQAVMSDLLEQEKKGKTVWCAPKPIAALLRRLRKDEAALSQQVPV